MDASRFVNSWTGRYRKWALRFLFGLFLYALTITLAYAWATRLSPRSALKVFAGFNLISFSVALLFASRPPNPNQSNP
jgi:hypothetical protein